MKRLLNRYLDGRINDDVPIIQARSFRKVLESVERGEEELGETPPDIRYHFPNRESVDMDLPCGMFMSRSEYGSIAETDFVERLKDRLGLYEDTQLTEPDTLSATPPE